MNIFKNEYFKDDFMQKRGTKDFYNQALIGQKLLQIWILTDPKA